MASTVRAIASGSCEVGLAVAGEAGDVGLADVDGVHLGAEVDEDARGRLAHPRRRARHDASAARVSEHVVHAPSSSLVERDCPLRTVLGTGARLRREVVAHLFVQDDAVAVVVGREHVGTEHVAPTVPGAHLRVDGHLHDFATGVNTSGRYSTARMPIV